MARHSQIPSRPVRSDTAGITGYIRCLIFLRRCKMNWQTPEYNNIRFGFEVTMYINNK